MTEPPTDTVVQETLLPEPETDPTRLPTKELAVTVLLIPSIVTDAGPTVRIPVTLASPSTYNL